MVFNARIGNKQGKTMSAMNSVDPEANLEPSRISMIELFIGHRYACLWCLFQFSYKCQRKIADFVLYIRNTLFEISNSCLYVFYFWFGLHVDWQNYSIGREQPNETVTFLIGKAIKNSDKLFDLLTMKPSIALTSKML